MGWVHAGGYTGFNGLLDHNGDAGALNTPHREWLVQPYFTAT